MSAESLGDFLQLDTLLRAITSLPVAALLGGALAYRPRRASTPRRHPEVIHAQIILAVVGALVMIVIGESLARAFGIVGAAGLVRYRAKIKNAKDAGVMLAALGIGLASGTGLYVVALVATAFFLLVLWLVESHEPVVYEHYRLTVSTAKPGDVRPIVESTLDRSGARYEVRRSNREVVAYDVEVPLGTAPATVSSELAALGAGDVEELVWEKEAGAGRGHHEKRRT